MNLAGIKSFKTAKNHYLGINKKTHLLIKELGQGKGYSVLRLRLRLTQPGEPTTANFD